MKQFVFLYPIPEYINSQINNGASYFDCGNKKNEFLGRLKKARSNEDREAIKVLLSEFKEFYKRNLNDCIDARYRKNGFGISYVIFNNGSMSDVIELQRQDRIIENGMDIKTHITKRPDGSYPYPDQDYILNQLGETNKLVIAGFHI